MVGAVSPEFQSSPRRFFNVRNLTTRSARILTSLLQEPCMTKTYGKKVLLTAWSPIISYNQIISCRYDTLQRYYIIMYFSTIKSTDIKKIIMFSRFFPLNGWRSLSEAVEKHFFQIMLNEWSSKNLWKMISAACKNQYKTTRNKKSGGCILHIFLDAYFLFWFWLVFPNPP